MSYTIQVPHASVTVVFPDPEADDWRRNGMVHTVFNATGRESKFVPNDSDISMQAARETGYGEDYIRFGIEHDMAHHFVAQKLGWPVSRVIWAAAHDYIDHALELDDMGLVQWPKRIWDEEHIVNKLLAYTNLGEADPYGVIEGIWGDDLPQVAEELTKFLQPVRQSIS